MKLYEIIDEVITGDWGEEIASNDSPCEVNCIRSADIVNYYNYVYDKIPVRYISLKSFNSRLLKEGDIIIEKSGGTNTCSTGRPIYVSNDLLKVNPKLICTNFCSAIRIKKKFNPIYIYYYIRLLHRNGVFHNFEGKTSGIHNLQMEQAFKAIDAPIISLEQQSSVANFLMKIDGLLYRSKLQINVLNAMSKHLYDYWFVQFDFPDENGRPYKSCGGKMVWNEQLKRDIPAGWDVNLIANVIDKVPSSKKLTTSEYLTDGTYPIVDQDSSKFIAGYTNDILSVVKKFPAVLFGDHSTCVKFLNFPFARGADGTQILYSKLSEVKQYFLYQYVSSLTIPNPGYSRHFKYLKEAPILIPSQHIADEYESVMTKVYTNKTTILKERRHLEKVRSYLLPLLMSGQVTVQ